MELNQTSICYYDRRLGRTASCTESTDAIVPDTFPDIGRVVCAYGTAAVKDQTPQSGRLLISGTVRTTVLYEPDGDGGLRRLSIPISFAHIEECDGLDADAVCFVSCKAASVDATSVNSRKVSVSVQLCFEVEGYQKVTCAVTESVDLPQVETRCTPCTVTLVEQAQSCPLTILEDVTLPDAGDLLLLHTTCTLRATECRAMNGKVELKGEAAVTCLALQEDDAVRMLNSTTPFTHILEMPVISEGDTVTATLAAREVDCRLEPDGLLSYTISAAALITMRQMQTVQKIDDLYLPGREVHLQQENVTVHSMPSPSPFATEVTETLQTAQHVSHVIAASALCCGIKRMGGDDLQVTTAVHLLYLGDDQKLCSLQRMVPLTVQCAAKGELSGMELTARASAAGEQGLTLTVSISGQAAEEAHCTFRCITGMETEAVNKPLDGVTLVLRYIDAEQPLWDIAKACGTTMEAIRRANELAADAQNVAQTMLLIPIGV